MGRIGKAGIMRTRGARTGERLGIAVGLAIALALGSMAVFSTDSALAEEAASEESDVAAQTAAIEEEYAPVVTELEDGTRIQRTPTEGENHTTLDTSYTYHLPEETVPYNTYYLKADQRGCNACHADLAETLNNMDYAHVDLSNSYGIQITVQMCIDCHTFGYGYMTNQNSFGSLIHGIHAEGQADCWNCHVATGSGDGMQLWDVEKHNQLRGITAVSDVQGEFAFDQDLTTSVEDAFDFDWNYYDLDYLRHDKTAEGAELDQEMFDTWTITVTGTDGTTKTWTLPDLIAEFDSVTVPVTFACTLNPTGGPLIMNAVYTGVPLNDVFASMGIDPTSEDFGGITSTAPDGFAESVQGSNYTEAYLVYQIDGESLPWAQGYPVQLMVPGSAAPASVKEVSDITVLTPEEAELVHEWNGWPRETEGTDYYTPGNWPFTDYNGYQNKPNVALFHFSEGQIIETGQPYEFTGYAYAYDKRIVAMEFSMDGGVTWTRYETPDTTNANWVIWHFTYTPEADSAYVLSIRSVAEDGSVTEEPIEVMFNAVTSDDGTASDDAAASGDEAASADAEDPASDAASDSDAADSSASE
jgi:DMSO/TMAO reductase YedYZ molybdopterin-dependent catalytic subunit